MSAAEPVTVPAPRRSRRGWWLLAALVLGLPLVASLTLWLWCGTQTDLDAAAERLRLMGLPTSRSGLGRVVADPDRLAKRRRIEALAVALDIYQNDYDARGESAWRRMVTTVPQGLSAFQVSCDVGQVAELEELLLGLGDQPLASTVELPLRFGDEFRPDRTWHFLRQRVLVAAAPEAERAARAALVLVRARDGVGALYTSHEFDRVLSAIAVRMASGALFSPALAHDLEATAIQLIAQRPRALAAQAVLYLALFRKGFIGTGKTLGIALPAIMETPVLNELIFRSGRAQIIDDLGAQAVFLRDHHQVREWFDEDSRRWSAMWSGGRRLSAKGLLAVVFGSMFNPGYVASLASLTMHTRILAAELLQSPWPEDLMDPGHHPLRRLESFGQCIGAYSVGMDGRDDGGGAGDVRFLLRTTPLGAVAAP